MDMPTYDPAAWFWIVGDDESRAWSSAAAGYVTDYPSERLTRIDTEANLTDVLRAYGLPGPAPAEADYAAAIQAHVDGVARSRRYESGALLASYVPSTIASWAAEAAAFVAWRDAVWVYAYQALVEVQNGEREQPSVSDLVAEIEPIEWPGL